MIHYPKEFDVIVVGGGHAGTEAALAAARLGAETLLITHNIETLGQMSCNPAIGGIGKGHLVKEIDALGGIMAKAADHAGIQFRILNASKGPAVRATRAQADRLLYKKFIREALENTPHLTLFQQGVDDLILENDRVCGVISQMGVHFRAKAVVLTVGTFLAGKIHIGAAQSSGGRAGDPPSTHLAERLRCLPFRIGRLKTGTPARIDGRTINWSVLEPQPGDVPVPVFSFLGKAADHPRQISCYITHTNEKTHDIIRKALPRSPLYSGSIEGRGPRYCPSIEDKVVRFDKPQHQIFVEPEGLTTTEVYPNGISTSLPFDVQWDFIRSIHGFENAHLVRPGYAIEYDYFDPRDLYRSLETKHIGGLFFAGQINGTTGYEEAAAQGLIAGLNAGRLAAGLPSWSPTRQEAYIGVLIDDLITHGTTEPYRMFTSRAEHRLLLREDNADARLTPMGYTLGLVCNQRWAHWCAKRSAIEATSAEWAKRWIHPGTLAFEKSQGYLPEPLAQEINALALLRRPEISHMALCDILEVPTDQIDEAVLEQVAIQLKYEGYIARQERDIAAQKKQENVKLPVDMDYSHIPGLSREMIEKFSQVRPETIGMASRIPGVTPAAIALLLIALKKMKMESVPL